MNISFIGLGKLGLCSAASFAAKGHRVIGVDSNPEILSALRARQCPIEETGLEDLLTTAWNNFSCTGSYDEAIAQSDLTMIIVPTPSMADGAFSNAWIEKALEQMAPALKAKRDFHIVDVVSTVMPGTCENLFIPLLERLTGKTCGKDFGLVYNPEFIALGSVIQNFLNPDMVLIGASDERSAETVRQAYLSTVAGAPVYAVMNLVNAEIAKLSLNCFVTMKISFANELAALCEKMPGADVDAVSDAIGADSRVGRKYLTGGLGFGGPCFPRDNQALQRAGAICGCDLRLSPAVVAVNQAVPCRIFDAIRRHVEPGQALALFGMSYKQDTHIVEESQSVMLARLLLAEGYGVRMHDPQALASAQKELGPAALCCADPYEAAQGAAALALLTFWPQFGLYDWQRLEAALLPGALVVDSRRMLRNVSFSRVVYLPLGLGRFHFENALTTDSISVGRAHEE
jgi:UDPglucose 6-dehydrogenase